MMKGLKGLGVLIVLLTVLSTVFSCGDDYKESGIEGQWRLRQIETSDGSRLDVDTIFYSFKKGVFRYLKLETDTQAFLCYGNYDHSDNSLTIEVSRDSFDPKDNDDGLDWNGLKRSFTIRKHTSSVLELESAGNLYHFGKY